MGIKASLVQSVNCQVKCNSIIEIGATKRENAARTTTMMTKMM